jgi:hypothetical protein
MIPSLEHNYHCSIRGCLKTCQASQATHHQMDHGDPDHGGTRLGDIRIILRSAAVPTTPGEGPLHDPACWQQEDALDPVGALDHLQADFAPGPSLPDPGDERPRLRLIGPDHAQARTAVPQGVQQGHGPVAVWHAGGRDHDREEQPERVDEEVPCAAVDLCGRVVAVAPPVSVVFTDCRSMIPALSWRRFPAATRTSPRSRSGIRCHVPACCQRQQYG